MAMGKWHLSGAQLRAGVRHLFGEQMDRKPSETCVLLGLCSAAGGLLQLQVEANITARVRLVQDKSGALKLVVENCKTLLGDVNIRVG